jgi:drug/metabolite transporter (DMT)-like permease
LGYLVSCGSLLGFVLYFYILKYLPTARVALITLIAPVLAMLWGNLLKGEVMTITSLLGCFALLLALALYQWHQRLDQGLKSVFLRLGIGQRSLEFKQKKS